MLQNDISELQNNPNFSLEASNGVYIVFLIIGIIGYFTIPTVAGWIIQAGGAGSYGLPYRSSQDGVLVWWAVSQELPQAMSPDIRGG